MQSLSSISIEMPPDGSKLHTWMPPDPVDLLPQGVKTLNLYISSVQTTTTLSPGRFTFDSLFFLLSNSACFQLVPLIPKGIPSQRNVLNRLAIMELDHFG